MSFLSKLALTIGTAASLAAAASPAMARPYFGSGGYGRGFGGYHGYHGGYGRGNSGALVVGALALGGIAALAASDHRRYYEGYGGDPYYRGGYYRGDVEPGYYAPPPPPPPPPYQGGYYEPAPQGYYGGGY